MSFIEESQVFKPTVVDIQDPGNFYQEFPQLLPYQIPDRFLILDDQGEIDLAETEEEIIAFAAGYLEDKDLESLKANYQEFFKILHIHPTDWLDFKATFPTAAIEVETTAFKIAGQLFDADQSLENDRPLTLQATEFLRPLIVVTDHGQEGEQVYGLGFGALHYGRTRYGHIPSKDSISSKYQWDRVIGEAIYKTLMDGVEGSLEGRFDNPFDDKHTAAGGYYEVGASSYQLSVLTYEGGTIAEDGTGILDVIIPDEYFHQDRDLRYDWEQVKGPEVNWDETAGSLALFEPNPVCQDEALTFRVTATDLATSREATSYVDYVVLNTENELPEVYIKGPSEVTPGAEFTLTASAFDCNEDPLSYQWQELGELSVQVDEEYSHEITVTAPQVLEDTILQFEVQVYDGYDVVPIPHDVLIQAPEVIIPPELAIDNAGNDTTEKPEPVLTKTTEPVPNLGKKEIIKENTQALVDLAEAFDTEVDEVSPEEALWDPMSPIFRALEKDEISHDYEIIFLIDGSGSMDINTHKLAAKARRVVQTARRQIEDDGTIRIALAYYGDRSTTPHWQSGIVSADDDYAVEALISELGQKTEEVAEIIPELNYGHETVWYSMWDILSGNHSDSLEFSNDSETHKRFVILSDYEVDDRFNEVGLPNGDPRFSREDAVSLAKMYGFDVRVVRFGVERKEFMETLFRELKYHMFTTDARELLDNNDPNNETRESTVELYEDIKKAILGGE